jgi:glutathione S-transferase
VIEVSDEETRMLTVYGHPFSPNTRKVTWALEEIGAQYTFTSVDLSKREQKSEDFLRMNPNGRVPVLDHKGFILYEANAILWYVAEQLDGGESLLPPTPRQRALVDQWMWWQATDLTIASRPGGMKIRERLGIPLDPKAYADALEAARPPLTMLDRYLDDKDFIIPGHFSIADIANAEFCNVARFGGVELAQLSNVGAWLARLGDRPAFKKTRPQ